MILKKILRTDDSKLNSFIQFTNNNSVTTCSTARNEECEPIRAMFDIEPPFFRIFMTADQCKMTQSGCISRCEVMTSNSMWDPGLTIHEILKYAFRGSFRLLVQTPDHSGPFARLFRIVDGATNTSILEVNWWYKGSISVTHMEENTIGEINDTKIKGPVTEIFHLHMYFVNNHFHCDVRIGERDHRISTHVAFHSSPFKDSKFIYFASGLQLHKDGLVSRETTVSMDVYSQSLSFN